MILLQESDRAPAAGRAARFRLGGCRARHLLDVLGARPGRALRVGFLDGALGTGTVVHTSDDEVELDCEFEPEPPPRPLVDLILAIPRPKRLADLLAEVTALGVDRIVLLRTWRVAKPYLTARVLKPEVYRPHLWDGLEQAGCTREPTVRVEPLFRPYVEDRLAAEFAGSTRLALHPGEAPALGALSLGADERVCLAIGPEGGFREFEIELLAGAGFTQAQLGGRTLRVDTAVVAALATVAAARQPR